MHILELLAEATHAAESLGFRVRREWLGGCGGPCQLKGQSWLFIDLSLSPVEQMDQVRQAIKSDPGHASLSMPPRLRQALGLRTAS